MQRCLPFDEFWEMVACLGEAGLKSLFYHSCCDVWTTKAGKTKGTSHKNRFAWHKLALTFDKTIEDKKQALLAKMTEEGWRLDIVINESCTALSSPILQQKIVSILHQPDIHPQDLQADLSSPDFASQDQPTCELPPSSSRQCFT